MSITPLARNLMIGGGILAAGGLGATIFLKERNERREADAAADAARGANLPVGDFVDGVIAHYDRGTIDAFGFGDHGHTSDTQAKDGVLALGLEDHGGRDVALHPETVAIEEGQLQSARAMLTRADADGNGNVTREELLAAVRPHAGPDGVFDEQERRAVLVDEGLGEPLTRADFPAFGAYSGSGVVRAGEVAAELVESGALGSLPFGQSYADEGDPAESVRIADVHASVADTGWGVDADDRTISSVAPFLASIDRKHGNADGRIARGELGVWVADALRDPKLPVGLVQAEDAVDRLTELVDEQRLGRLDTSRLSGGAYYDTTVPQGDVDAHYGGDLPAWLDTHATVGRLPLGEYRGDAEWQPDPRSGATADVAE